MVRGAFRGIVKFYVGFRRTRVPFPLVVTWIYILYALVGAYHHVIKWDWLP